VGQVNSDLQREKSSAEGAVRADAEEIDSFCDEVLNAFGKGGRMIPNLINDPRRGA
jgi:hypothetical protein